VQIGRAPRQPSVFTQAALPVHFHADLYALRTIGIHYHEPLGGQGLRPGSFLRVDWHDSGGHRTSQETGQRRHDYKDSFFSRLPQPPDGGECREPGYPFTRDAPASTNARISGCGLPASDDNCG
jgi:hypothetical protein